jgi:hypothetical protein
MKRNVIEVRICGVGVAGKMDACSRACGYVKWKGSLERLSLPKQNNQSLEARSGCEKDKIVSA